MATRGPRAQKAGIPGASFFLKKTPKENTQRKHQKKTSKENAQKKTPKENSQKKTKDNKQRNKMTFV
jgi:hypothetical protein